MNDYEDRLAELGIPSDAVAELVDARLAQAIELREAAARNPHMQYLREHDAEIGAALSANPQMADRVGRMLRVDALGAAEYLSLAHQHHSGRRGAPRAEVAAPVNSPASPQQRGGTRMLTDWPGAGDGETVVPDKYDRMMQSPEAMDELRRRVAAGDRQAAKDYGHCRLRASGCTDHIW